VAFRVTRCRQAAKLAVFTDLKILQMTAASKDRRAALTIGQPPIRRSNIKRDVVRFHPMLRPTTSARALCFKRWKRRTRPCT
jgi:hypothetical protein